MNLTDPPAISIPITAINETNSQTFVTIYDGQSGKLKQVPVQTGKTSETSVMITSGLKAGDRLVVPD
jgi:multidrug efflux pump subunit AcrA (membrane-fusion protein)